MHAGKAKQHKHHLYKMIYALHMKLPWQDMHNPESTWCMETCGKIRHSCASFSKDWAQKHAVHIASR